MEIRSIRELFRKLPADGKVRQELRSFNMQMMGVNSPPSVVALANRLGVQVVLRDLPRSQRGRLVRDPFEDCGFVIEVNSSDDVRTRRWTVLHELMHWLLHRRKDMLAAPQFRAGASHFYDASEATEEKECNEFVEALIFGDGALRAGVSLMGRDVSVLSKHFGVSDRALQIALAKLR
jgi:Zn-dependent peptidase ImmA (M78 family)